MEDNKHKVIIKEFVMFLKRNDAYAKFRYYYYDGSIDGILYDPFHSCNYEHLIFLAMPNDATMENAKFWTNLDKEWKKKMKTLNEK